MCSTKATRESIEYLSDAKDFLLSLVDSSKPPLPYKDVKEMLSKLDSCATPCFELRKPHYARLRVRCNCKASSEARVKTLKKQKDTLRDKRGSTTTRKGQTKRVSSCKFNVVLRADIDPNTGSIVCWRPSETSSNRVVGVANCFVHSGHWRGWETLSESQRQVVSICCSAGTPYSGTVAALAEAGFTDLLPKAVAMSQHGVKSSIRLYEKRLGSPIEPQEELYASAFRLLDEGCAVTLGFYRSTAGSGPIASNDAVFFVHGIPGMDGEHHYVVPGQAGTGVPQGRPGEPLVCIADLLREVTQGTVQLQEPVKGTPVSKYLVGMNGYLTSSQEERRAACQNLFAGAQRIDPAKPSRGVFMEAAAQTAGGPTGLTIGLMAFLPTKTILRIGRTLTVGIFDTSFCTNSQGMNVFDLHCVDGRQLQPCSGPLCFR